MENIIRQAIEKDFFDTEFLTREAFWNVYKPGANEHLVLKQLRKSKCYIPELDIVKIYDGKIIGHIISTKAKVVSDDGIENEILCAGPLSVTPELQKKGFAKELMNYTINTAARLGYKGIILFGNPDYYRRFGFKNAKEYLITTKDGMNYEPFMALELGADTLKDIKGKFYEDDAFETDEDVLFEYEKQFPYKEKLVTDTQLKE